jgi:hypothetical protein
MSASIVVITKLLQLDNEYHKYLDYTTLPLVEG